MTFKLLKFSDLNQSKYPEIYKIMQPSIKTFEIKTLVINLETNSASTFNSKARIFFSKKGAGIRAGDAIGPIELHEPALRDELTKIALDDSTGTRIADITEDIFLFHSTDQFDLLRKVNLLAPIKENDDALVKVMKSLAQEDCPAQFNNKAAKSEKPIYVNVKPPEDPFGIKWYQYLGIPLLFGAVVLEFGASLMPAARKARAEHRAEQHRIYEKLMAEKQRTLAANDLEMPKQNVPTTTPKLGFFERKSREIGAGSNAASQESSKSEACGPR